MIPPDIAATMREALVIASEYYQRVPINANEYPKKFDRIDAAMQYLDTLPAAPAPDWSKAPEWATHHVYNCVGSGLWINGEAKVDTTWASGWRRVLRQTMDGHTDYSGYQLPIGIDWRETLTARPTETP